MLQEITTQSTSINQKNRLILTDFNLLCYLNSFDGPLLYLLPSLKNNNLYHPFRKPFKLIHLKNKISQTFLFSGPRVNNTQQSIINSNNNNNIKREITDNDANNTSFVGLGHFTQPQSPTSLFYKSFFNIKALNNPLSSLLIGNVLKESTGYIHLSTFPFNSKIKDKNNSFKFLPLPKAPKNEILYHYLRKYASSPSFPGGHNNSSPEINSLNYFSALLSGDTSQKLSQFHNGSYFLPESFMKEKYIELSIKHYYSKTFNAYTLIENLSRFLISFIKKNKGGKNKFQQLKNITYKVLQFLIHNQFRGVAFSFSGRVYGAKKGMSFKMLFGSVPFSTLTQNIDYAKLMQKTRNGTWGFQIWLHLKRKKTRQVLPIKNLDSIISSNLFFNTNLKKKEFSFF